jgi:hypothetical protein
MVEEFGTDAFTYIVYGSFDQAVSWDKRLVGVKIEKSLILKESVSKSQNDKMVSP